MMPPEEQRWGVVEVPDGHFTVVSTGDPELGAKRFLMPPRTTTNAAHLDLGFYLGSQRERINFRISALEDEIDAEQAKLKLIDESLEGEW